MPVYSEIDILKKVIVHEPDFGIEKVTPEIAEELLYDDIVYLPRMIEEHRVFTASLKLFLGEENVLEFEALLIRTLMMVASLPGAVAVPEIPASVPEPSGVVLVVFGLAGLLSARRRSRW